MGAVVSVSPCCHVTLPTVMQSLRRAVPEPLLDNKLDLWILHHPDIRSVHRVRLFVDYITNLVRSDLDLFEGRRPL